MRILISLIAAVALLATTTVCASHLLQTRAEHQAASVITTRLQSLGHEQARWQPDGGASIAEQGRREEALRTLKLLNNLYTQEQRLWTYYEALAQQRDTTAAYRQDRLALQQTLAEHERALERLQQDIDTLRPPAEAKTGITFSDND